MSHKKQCSFSSKSEEYKEPIHEQKIDCFQRFETTYQSNPALYTADLVGILGELNTFHPYALVVPGSHKCSRFFDLLFKHQVTLFTHVTSSIFRTDFIFDTLHEVNTILETLHNIQHIDPKKDTLQMATIRTIYQALGEDYMNTLPQAFQILEIRLPKPSLVIFHPQLYVRYITLTHTSGFAGLRTVMRKKSECNIIDRFRQRLQQWEGERLGQTGDNTSWPMTIRVDPTNNNHPLARMEHTYHQSFDTHGYIVTSLSSELIQVHLFRDIEKYLKRLIGLPNDIPMMKPNFYTYLPTKYIYRTHQVRTTHFHESGFIGYGHFCNEFYQYVEKIKPFYYTLLRVLLEGEGTVATTEIIFRICRQSRDTKSINRADSLDGYNTEMN